MYSVMLFTTLFKLQKSLLHIKFLSAANPILKHQKKNLIIKIAGRFKSDSTLAQATMTPYSGLKLRIKETSLGGFHSLLFRIVCTCFSLVIVLMFP